MKRLGAIAVLVAFPAIAQSFLRTQVPGREPDAAPLCISWNKRDFPYVVDEAGSAQTPGDSEFVAIDAAFASWQAVSDTCSDFKFTRAGRLPDVKVGKTTEGTNVLVFREKNCRTTVPESDPCQADGSCANVFHCWDHSDFTLGLTTTTFSTRTGIIYDADVELNSSPHLDGKSFLFTTISSPPCEEGLETVACVATDVQNTVTHEIGHAVGFDHVDVRNSLMEPTAPIGETQKRIIDLGTADGFCGTYPKGLPPVPCDELAQLRRKIIATSTGTALLGCSAVGGGPGLLWGLLLAVIGLSRRR